MEIQADSSALRSVLKPARGGAQRTIPDRTMKLHDGRSLGYLDYGDPEGTPIICCHGLPGSRLEFPQEEDVLRASRVRLIVPDRPGMGLSDFQRKRTMLDWPDDVMQLADHLSVDRFVVLGVSGGGAYAAACGYKLPQRVIRIGLVSSVAPMTVSENVKGTARSKRALRLIARYMPWFIFRRAGDLAATLARRHPEILYDVMLEQLRQANRIKDYQYHLTPEFKESIVEPFRQGGCGDAWEKRLQLGPWGFRLEDITVETYVWQGELDALSPAVMGHYLARTIPNCHATFYAGEGHLLLNKHWREILEVLAT